MDRAGHVPVVMGGNVDLVYSVYPAQSVLALAHLFNNLRPKKKMSFWRLVDMDLRWVERSTCIIVTGFIYRAVQLQT